MGTERNNATRRNTKKGGGIGVGEKRRKRKRERDKARGVKSGTGKVPTRRLGGMVL